MKREGKALLQAAPRGTGPAVNRLFYGCKNALAVYDLKLCLATGAQVQAARVPACLLPALLLLLQVDATIVDDPSEVCTLVEEEYSKSVPGFWHPEGHLVSAIVLRNLPAKEMQDVPDFHYVYSAYQELTNEYAAVRLGVGKRRRAAAV